MKVCTEVPCVPVKCDKASVVKKYRRTYKRNLYRRSRRKRSKLRYYTHLKQLRFKRKTDDLCSAITVFDITDMDWAPFVSTTSTEVTEWHKQEQIAYWKSRALSLEYENRMLLRHIRNVYAKQTEDYANYVKGQQQIEEAPSAKSASFVEPAGKKRREEMEKLYGKKASKIMGMETAVQLNYDLHLEDAGKLPHWPHTPLNLRFD
ncbi:GEMIN8 domain containing protein [Asbolus verrucosus]|uniref:GEMIN8 domain containing protein n=1 Tax=Asbolus verrucosus TaxID=1661398 RepID=A0A482VQR3_ASBVE|nr:GEMIN8 domain containing protein [Asbolus verrucosus]